MSILATAQTGLRTSSLLTSPINNSLLPGVSWGKNNVLYTPAFWRHQAELAHEDFKPACHRLGATLIEEVAACLLGGYGIPAEIGLAAFQNVRTKGLLAPPSPSAAVICRILRQPMSVRDRHVRYRFAQQKAGYLSAAIKILTAERPPMVSGYDMRNWLLRLPGVGYKTASWIARNWLDSDEVAIIDIHIHRAGILAGFFSVDNIVSRDYLIMEERFLAFSRCLGVRPSILDALMWRHMRDSNGIAIRTLRAMTELRPTDSMRKVA